MIIDNPKIIIKNYNTNAVSTKIKRKNFDPNIIIRKNQYNRNNKSVRWKRRPHLGIGRNFNPALSFEHSLSGKVIELLHSYTRHPLFARNSAFTWQLEKAYGHFRERKKERGFCTNSQFAFYVDVTDVQAMKRKDLPASFNRGTGGI